ncbi:MAG TPA: hypothetical protein VGH93_12190 [Solirubrobacteraceae bacterium]|jgi:hypothetical protein
MNRPPEEESVLRLVDSVLDDLAVRSAMYVHRRAEDGDAESFVIQTGEEGRCRLRLPDLDSDPSIEATVAEAQAYLAQILDVPVPLCPMHQHALVGVARHARLRWECPDGGWGCELGDYDEQTWPQLDVASLAPILSRRLQRRGAFPAVRLIGVTRAGDEPVAEFGLAEVNDELLRVLADVAAPLPVRTHLAPDIRPRRLSPAD